MLVFRWIETSRLKLINQLGTSMQEMRVGDIGRRIVLAGGHVHQARIELDWIEFVLVGIGIEALIFWETIVHQSGVQSVLVSAHSFHLCLLLKREPNAPAQMMHDVYHTFCGWLVGTI